MHSAVADEQANIMLARYYSSSVARFMAVDPINGARSGQPLTWNKYVYVRNNPLALVDPDGRDPLNSVAIEYLNQPPPPSGPAGPTALAVEKHAKAASSLLWKSAAITGVEALAMWWMPIAAEILGTTAATCGGLALTADVVAALANPAGPGNQKALAIDLVTLPVAGVAGSTARALGASKGAVRGIEAATGAAVGAVVTGASTQKDDRPAENENKSGPGDQVHMGDGNSRMPLTAKEESKRDREAARK